MKGLWWLSITGLVFAIAGGWRLIWRVSAILGLLGANKLGTAKGEQVEQNRQNIEKMKKGIPGALIISALGIILFFVF